MLVGSPMAKPIPKLREVPTEVARAGEGAQSMPSRTVPSTAEARPTVEGRVTRLMARIVRPVPRGGPIFLLLLVLAAGGGCQRERPPRPAAHGGAAAPGESAHQEE